MWRNLYELVAKSALSLTCLAFLIPVVTCAQTTTPSTPAASPTLSPMPTDAKPSFDVATIKPNDAPTLHGTYFRTNGRYVIAYNISVAGLISYAYGLQAKQIVDGPSSLLSEHFDINGVPDVEGRPNHAQALLMFQNLLLSRFKLAFHYEPRELPAYAIQVARDGSKLIQTKSKPGDGFGFTYTCQAVLTARNVSMNDVAKGLQDTFLDKPVVDQTGLPGRYDFSLAWTPDESQNYCPRNPARSREDDPNAPPGFFTAIQEQLGLKLVSTKASIPVMIVDHIETPTGN